MDNCELNSVRGKIAAGRDVELRIDRYISRDTYEMRVREVRVRVAARPCPACETRLLGERMDVCAHCAERFANQQCAIAVVRFVVLVIGCAIALTPLLGFEGRVWSSGIVMALGLHIAWHAWGEPILARLHAFSPRLFPRSFP